ncbi:MAG: PQQ-binding-like beta-propeller repeat protein [Armatimonadia bacterium]|nr:PQQ-binding-like beta-propeller repeat protein [Armatimonadia bacterium]
MDYRSRWKQKRRERATRQRLILIVGLLLAVVGAVLWYRGIARSAPTGYQLPGPVISHLTATTDGLLITTRTGELRKVTPQLTDVREGWVTPFTHPAGFWGRAAITDGTALLGCEDVRVRAVDVTTGVQTWELEVGGAVPGVTGIGQYAYFASAEPALYAVTAEGTQIWRTPLQAEVASSPLVTEETVVVGTLEGSICAYERASGARLWCVEPPFTSPIYARPTMGPSSILVGDDGGLLHSIARTGELLASMEFEGLIRQPVAAQDAVVVVGDSTGLVRRINPADMTEIWSTTIPGVLTSEPIIEGNRAWCGAGRNLIALDVDSGSTVIRRVAEAHTCDVTMAHGRIYWATTDGRIGAVSTSD